jgi:hypothetical protein
MSVPIGQNAAASATLCVPGRKGLALWRGGWLGRAQQAGREWPQRSSGADPGGLRRDLAGEEHTGVGRCHDVLNSVTKAETWFSQEVVARPCFPYSLRHPNRA